MSNIDRLSLALDDIDIGTGPIGIFNAQPRLIYEQLRGASFQQKMKPLYDRALRMGLVEDAGGELQIALVEITRNKVETQGIIAEAYGRLVEGGILILNGDKSDGIESHLKAVRKLLGVEQVISKAHGKVFWLQKTGTPEIFEEWIGQAQASVNLDGFTTKPGVFSSEHIDNGSYFLNECLPPLSGRVADLGAGWGYLAQAALGAHAEITSFDLIEADAVALACAQENVKDPRAVFHWADALEFQAEPYDWILMNPPFHQSRKKDENLGKAFIQAASRLLHQGGELWMVANRQLAYEDSLKSCFATGEILHQSPQYKIIRAGKPRG